MCTIYYGSLAAMIMTISAYELIIRVSYIHRTHTMLSACLRIQQWISNITSIINYLVDCMFLYVLHAMVESSVVDFVRRYLPSFQTVWLPTYLFVLYDNCACNPSSLDTTFYEDYKFRGCKRV